MGRPLSEAARDKARAAAFEVIATSGVAGFTVDAVAKRSGVAKSTIYRHWDSANALLIDTIDCMVVPFPTPDTGSMAGDLQSFLDVLTPMFDDPTMIRTMLGTMAAAAFDEELGRIHQELITERKRPIREMIERAQARGEIRDDVPIETIIDMIEGPFLARFLLRRSERNAGDERLMVELIMNSLRRHDAG